MNRTELKIVHLDIKDRVLKLLCLDCDSIKAEQKVASDSDSAVKVYAKGNKFVFKNYFYLLQSTVNALKVTLSNQFTFYR